MGGGSEQIAFDCTSGECNTPGDLIEMDLYGQSYSVFSTSHLCYGLQEAMRR